MATPSTSATKSPAHYKSYILGNNCAGGTILKFNFSNGTSTVVAYKNTGTKTSDGRFNIYDIEGDGWELDTKVLSKEHFVIKAYQEGANFIVEIIKAMNSTRHSYKKAFNGKTLKSVVATKSGCIFSAPVVNGQENLDIM